MGKVNEWFQCLDGMEDRAKVEGRREGASEESTGAGGRFGCDEEVSTCVYVRSPWGRK